MFAKILSAILGFAGIVTITVQAPIPQQAGAAEPRPPVVQTAPKSATTTENSNEKLSGKSGGKNKTADFSPLKSDKSVAKPSAKTPEKKTVTKNPPPKPAGTAAVPAGLASTSPSSSVPTSPLSTLHFPLSTTTSPINFEPVNQAARKALVNILCVSKSGGSFEPLSGSGVIIDPRGVILTNAHVAQYLLLENYHGRKFITCIARTGSPAVPAYTVTILYISPRWVQNNYQQITSSRAMGTGEDDFALLQIASSTNPDLHLPTTFPYLPTDDNEDHAKRDDPVLLAAYPAGFLGGIAIQRDLYITSTIVNVGKRYTFKTGSLDAFSLGGSPVAQHGSSGGAAVSADGKLLGIIVTSTDAADTSTRDLDAISIGHINRSLAADTGLTLESLFASDISTLSQTFGTETLPKLKKLLTDELDSKNRQ